MERVNTHDEMRTGLRTPLRASNSIEGEEKRRFAKRNEGS